ncbi:MAG TPA: hypothetical protein PKJ24_04685 [Prolixibacteraceae bacterium]|nr:hypothetical protein [Prolixibacteraceae bacterium]
MMIKKTGNIILSVLLFVSTVGIAVSRHYCGSSFVSVSFFSEAKSCCDSDRCCHNENHFFKVQDDYTAPQVTDLPELTSTDLPGYRLSDDGIRPASFSGNGNLVFTDLPPPYKIENALTLKQAFLL